MPKMNAATLQVLVARHADINRNFVIPNVSHSFFPWETDVLALSAAGYATEYEIKVSVADFKREWRKERWRSKSFLKVFRNRIRRYVIVVPHEIADKCVPHIPDDLGAGVLSFEPQVDWKGNKHLAAHELIKPRINTKARKWTDSERIHLGELAAIRYWQQRRKAIGLERF